MKTVRSIDIFYTNEIGKLYVSLNNGYVASGNKSTTGLVWTVR